MMVALTRLEILIRSLPDLFLKTLKPGKAS